MGGQLNVREKAEDYESIHKFRPVDVYSLSISDILFCKALHIPLISSVSQLLTSVQKALRDSYPLC